MNDRSVSILDGNTFIISDGCGDIEPSSTTATGLFYFDTRFLSKWTLSINGKRLSPLSVDDLQFFEARFFLVPGAATQYVDSNLSVIRHRWVGGSFDEQLIILNGDENPADIVVRLEIDSDFADLFEVKNQTSKKGIRTVRAERDRLRFLYERETFARGVTISSSEPAQVDGAGMTFRVHIAPQGMWSTHLHIDTIVRSARDRDIRENLKVFRDRQRQQMRRDLDDWLAQAPELRSDCEHLKATYVRSLVDLKALQYQTLTVGGQAMTAGLPWFMTLFGRDSILTTLQMLPFLPQIAVPTLRNLAAIQGIELNDFRDEAPGKIMHEIRYGETSAFEEQPHSPYYGASDSTPLFVILLDEYERWSGDTKLVQELEQEARAAISWIDDYGDLLHNGYIWYETRNPQTGLENQCWKDSWDSISYPDGRLPGFPRATCEVQGYAYDAKVRAARLARLAWKDPAYADRLEHEAAELKARFNRDYWVENGGFYALALDAHGGQVDSLSSNIGHLLWSGIVDKERAEKVVGHLMGERLYSGWGIRTLATGEARFNAIGYHVGTVWPFDNSFIAWGLRRYGYAKEAARIARDILAAAQFFDGRLPEAFAGYDRDLTKYPVQYPTACSPQAWSSGTPLLLIRTMLGLEPYQDHLATNPAVPREYGRIELLNVKGRWGHTDAFARGRF